MDGASSCWAAEGSANDLVVGEQGEIHPGDFSREQHSAGDLVIWHPDDSKDYGSLKFENGTLFIDLAAKTHDALVFDSENKCANVTGGTLSVICLTDIDRGGQMGNHPGNRPGDRGGLRDHRRCYRKGIQVFSKTGRR